MQFMMKVRRNKNEITINLVVEPRSSISTVLRTRTAREMLVMSRKSAKPKHFDCCVVGSTLGFHLKKVPQAWWDINNQHPLYPQNSFQNLLRDERGVLYENSIRFLHGPLLADNLLGDGLTCRPTTEWGSRVDVWSRHVGNWIHDRPIGKRKCAHCISVD